MFARPEPTTPETKKTSADGLLRRVQLGARIDSEGHFTQRFLSNGALGMPLLPSELEHIDNCNSQVLNAVSE